MFKTQPNVFAHVSALKNGNFVLNDKIIIKNDSTYNIKSRTCPHRAYMMHSPGDQVNQVVCKLHGFAWDQNGQPLNIDPYCNHFYKMHHLGTAELGQSRILFENFKEPENAEWVNILNCAPELHYEHSVIFDSKGSWLWFMEQLTDLLHIRKNGIHPRQSLETPLDNIETNFGDGWSLQKYFSKDNTNGFWLFIYPGFNIEYEHGKLLVSRVTPNNKDDEYGFNVHLQFYYSKDIDKIDKENWEKCIEVYKEDLAAIENIKKPFFPLKKPVNKYEELSLHWGKWFQSNIKK